MWPSVEPLLWDSLNKVTTNVFVQKFRKIVSCQEKSGKTQVIFDVDDKWQPRCSQKSPFNLTNVFFCSTLTDQKKKPFTQVKENSDHKSSPIRYSCSGTLFSPVYQYYGQTAEDGENNNVTETDDSDSTASSKYKASQICFLFRSAAEHK